MLNGCGRGSRTSRLFLAAAVSCLATVVTACGSDDPEGSATVQVTPEASAMCHGIEERSRLAKAPPRIEGYQLRTQDLDNFSGASETACNQRHLVFWGPFRDTTSRNRLAVSVTMQFFDRAPEAARAAAILPKDERLDLDPGALSQAYRVPGEQFTARFSTGKALVAVSTGCADPSGGVELRRCTRVPDAILSAELQRATEALESELSDKLSSSS